MLVCFFLRRKREIKKKKVWHLQPISSIWRSLVFLPVGFSLQKNIYFCFMDCGKTFDCVDHNKLWQILKEMEIPGHLTCLLRNVYAGQEATVRTRCGTIAWFKIWKALHQGCILSLCLFNLYAEYIMWNARLDEAQAGIKIARRNINNLRNADDTTLMAESDRTICHDLNILNVEF